MIFYIPENKPSSFNYKQQNACSLTARILLFIRIVSSFLAYALSGFKINPVFKSFSF